MKFLFQTNRRYWAIPALLVLFIYTSSLFYGRFKPLPNGAAYDSGWKSAEDVEFLADLTFRKDGKTIHEQNIFSRVYELIENAEQTLVVDMFLFNDEYNRQYEYPTLSNDLVSAILAQKKKKPDLKIHVISDPINSFYGSYETAGVLNLLSEAGIPVTLTDLDVLRHSNVIYSAFYAPFLSHFGVRGKGWISNPFSPDSPEISMRAMLKMLNFRANHRKIICSEKEAIISSANPHDASAYHSNIAFCVKGSLIPEIIKAEEAVAKLSGADDFPSVEKISSQPNSELSVKLLSEGEILDECLEIINRSENGDFIKIAMFYFSERHVVKSIKRASERGVKFELIFDANKDAFGREKNGIPNRQVASELVNSCADQLNVRWYHTEGEQFHSKLMIANLKSEQSAYLIGGSANITRRNIGNYNLESNLCVKLKSDHDLFVKTSNYFSRMWNNQNGLFTDDYETFRDDSWFKKIIYRIQEFTGACTF